MICICSYALFDTDGRQVSQELVENVGKVFADILEEARFSCLVYALCSPWLGVFDLSFC